MIKGITRWDTEREGFVRVSDKELSKWVSASAAKWLAEQGEPIRGVEVVFNRSPAIVRANKGLLYSTIWNCYSSKEELDYLFQEEEYMWEAREDSPVPDIHFTGRMSEQRRIIQSLMMRKQGFLRVFVQVGMGSNDIIVNNVRFPTTRNLVIDGKDASYIWNKMGGRASRWMKPEDILDWYQDSRSVAWYPKESRSDAETAMQEAVKYTEQELSCLAYLEGTESLEDLHGRISSELLHFLALVEAAPQERRAIWQPYAFDI